MHVPRHQQTQQKKIIKVKINKQIQNAYNNEKQIFLRIQKKIHLFNFTDERKFSKIQIQIQEKANTYTKVMNKLFLCLAVFALLYSSSSVIIDGYGQQGTARKFRDDENLIYNGDFTLPQMYSFRTVQIAALEEWSTNEEIERGRGFMYNANWGNKIVIELDGHQNDRIRQRLHLYPGHYILSFKWAGRANHLKSSGMSIYWNKHRIFEALQPTDDFIHEQHIPIFVPRETTSFLELRGEEYSDAFGMTVTDFALKKVKSKKYNYLINSPVNDAQTFDRANQDLQLGQNPAL